MLLSLKLEFHSPTETGRLIMPPPNYVCSPKSIAFTSLRNIILIGRHTQETERYRKFMSVSPSRQSFEKVQGGPAVFLPTLRSQNNFTFSWQYGAFSGKIWILLLFLFLTILYIQPNSLYMHAKMYYIIELQSQSLRLLKGRYRSSQACGPMPTRNYARVQLSSSAEVWIMSLFAEISVVLKDMFRSLLVNIFLYMFGYFYLYIFFQS